MGVFEALSVAAMVLGAVLAPVLIARTSLRTSFVVLGIATVVVTFACLGASPARRAEPEARGPLASRLAVIERLRSRSEPRESCWNSSPQHHSSARSRRESTSSSRGACRASMRWSTEACGPPERRGGAHIGPGLVRGRGSDNAPGMRPSPPRCEHDHAHRGRRAARRAPVCPHGAVGDRSLQQGAVAGAPVEKPPLWWTIRPGSGRERRGATVVVISAGYEGKRRAHVRMAELGARS